MVSTKKYKKMTQPNSVPGDTLLQQQVAELQKRVDSLEDILDNGKEVLTVEEAAKVMGMARSTLYKMTCEQSIPFYRPNGKMIFFEKADILAWIRRNRVSTQEEIDQEARMHMQRLSNKRANT
jgi:excisionase family DNA binding protein